MLQGQNTHLLRIPALVLYYKIPSSCSKGKQLEFHRGISGNRENCFLWFLLFSLAFTLGFVTLQAIYMHTKKLYNTLRKGENQKSIISPL